jgi:ribosome-associated protein
MGRRPVEAANSTHTCKGADRAYRFPPGMGSPSTYRMPTTSSLPAAAIAQRAAQILLDNKANDVVVLDLRGVTDMTDFFIIASGTSDTHVRALGDHVLEDLKKEGARAHHVEGLTQGRWVLLDYVDFVVHVFHPTLRNFYQLERLWSDAEVIPVESQGAGA